MIGSLLMFLGSAGYIGYKAAASAHGKAVGNSVESRYGLNTNRQVHLESLAVGGTPENRREFVSLLENADLSKVSLSEIHKAKQKELVELYKQYDYYHSVDRRVQCFNDMVPIKDKEYAVWIIAQSEGWTYNKCMLCELPSYCYGYDLFKDTKTLKAMKRI